MRKSIEQKEKEARILRLKEVVQELGLSQNEICNRINIKQPYFSAVVNGKKTLSAELASKISNAFGISANWLLYGEGQKYAPGEAGELQKKNQLQKIAAIRETINAALKQLQELENEVNK